MITFYINSKFLEICSFVIGKICPLFTNVFRFGAKTANNCVSDSSLYFGQF